MRELVRLTIDTTTNTLTVEEGKEAAPGLTIREQAEMIELQKELDSKNFSDFATAEEMNSSERKDLMTKKQRLEQLKEASSQPRTIWETVPTPKSLMLMHQAGWPIEYVEELPTWLLDKVRYPTVIEIKHMGVAELSKSVQELLRSGQIKIEKKPEEPEPDYEYKQYEKSEPEQIPVLKGYTRHESVVIKTMVDGGVKDWNDKVVVETKGNLVVVTPKKWLGGDWSPINTVLKAEFGDHWIKDSKQSRWEIQV